MNINQIIVNTACNYIGYCEISGNKGFQNEKFEDLMKNVGWQKGQAWCAYFTELVWKEAYQQYNAYMFPTLDKLFSAGAVATFNNFKKVKEFEISEIPVPGSVVIWQKYKDGMPHWTGHAGIVTEVYKDVFKSVEGNTNDSGGREGIEVAEKLRDVDFRILPNTLVLKGFIHPVS